MVPRARRPTRPARERASLHPCGAGREKKGRREATGRSAPGARADGHVRCVCARGGAPQGAEESEKRGWTERGRVGRAAPCLPHRTRPVCPSRASSPGAVGVDNVPPVGPPEATPARHHAASPATVVVISRRASPTRPPRHVPRGLGPRVLGGRAPPRAPPSLAPVTPPRSRLLPCAEPPVRLGMGGVAAVAAPPWGRLPAPSPSRRRPWTGSFPVVGPPLWALCPLAVRLGLSSEPGASPPSSVRLSLSFPPSTPPCAPCPLVPPLPVGASLTALGGEKGARDVGAGQGPRVGGLGFRRKEGRARARVGGLRLASWTRWGPRRAVAVVVSCGGRPGARPGPRVTGR